MTSRHALIMYGLIKKILNVIAPVERVWATTKQYSFHESLFNAASSPMGCICSAGVSGVGISVYFESESHLHSTDNIIKVSGGRSTATVGVMPVDVVVFSVLVVMAVD